MSQPRDLEVPAHIWELEAEAIAIMREATAQLQKVGLLFSGGKDSIVMAHLARLAFGPGPMKIPLVHIDTGHNFPEVLTFRDDIAHKMDFDLVVGHVQDDLDSGRAPQPKDSLNSRNRIQSVTLNRILREKSFDGVFGGGRRDEEKARAKERVFSLRDSTGGWNPEKQRPEIWDVYNLAHQSAEHFRIFPLSDWTELDVWLYIHATGIQVPSLYFSHQRDVFAHQGVLYADNPFVSLDLRKNTKVRQVRFRTVGDMSCTAAFPSEATTAAEIIGEIRTSDISERGLRMDDRFSEVAMEERKREGYF